MLFDQTPMPSFHPKSVRESGQDWIGAPDATPTPDPEDGGATAPDQGFSPLLPDLSKFDLTVGEALEVFRTERRRTPSTRTLQRYCQEGRFSCYKLKTTRNGNPVHEWIISSSSLRAFVRSRPKDKMPDAMAVPGAPDDTNGDAGTRKGGQQPASATATPVRAADTSRDLALARSSEDEPDVTAAPEETDDASGGQMSRAKLLIENAKLTAQLDAQSELVGELREDKRFMREEIAQHRNNDQALADMHRETLQTLKAVAVAGRHTKIEMPGDSILEERSGTYRDVTDSEHRAPRHDSHGV